MKHAVLGAAGQLGREFCRQLFGEAIPLTRDQVDLTHPDTVRLALGKLRPQIVINCAAFNFVDRAETESAAAFTVNTHGVRELALACRDLDCTLVHFSTDYVFGLDPERRAPLTEQDPPGPVSVYGTSKLAGEYLVRAYCPRHFVIRTCGLYGMKGSGGKGGNFVETMLRLAQAGKPLRVVADQVCTPTSAADLASAIIPLITTQHYGLYHLTNAGACSWYEFARSIFEFASQQVDLTPIASTEYAAPARRPAFSVLSTALYESLGFPPPRRWPEALAAYLAARQ
ncbi:MAG TPA: dTDP-4-dehydrorhamnose reductase [Gemmataceae bacterium]|nr:dTDP-4-dehydrorhamnose reductase [Gemmataceae bacterium]